jgi:hypothetical protein
VYGVEIKNGLQGVFLPCVLTKKSGIDEDTKRMHSTQPEKKKDFA